jgi:hypothetical protein
LTEDDGGFLLCFEKIALVALKILFLAHPYQSGHNACNSGNRLAFSLDTAIYGAYPKVLRL